VFTDEANFLPSKMVGDLCDGKKIDLKTVASRNVMGCVVRHYWLWWGLLCLMYWLVLHPYRRFDRVLLSSEMRSIRHLWTLCRCCGPGLCACGRKRPSVPACFVNDYTERERNRTYGLAWPSPHVNLTRACMVQTPKTYKCSDSSTTDAGDLANALI